MEDYRGAHVTAAAGLSCEIMRSTSLASRLIGFVAFCIHRPRVTRTAVVITVISLAPT